MVHALMHTRAPDLNVDVGTGTVPPFRRWRTLMLDELLVALPRLAAGPGAPSRQRLEGREA